MSYRRYVRVPVEDLRDGVLDTAADHRPDQVDLGAFCVRVV